MNGLLLIRLHLLIFALVMLALQFFLILRNAVAVVLIPQIKRRLCSTQGVLLLAGALAQTSAVYAGENWPSFQNGGTVSFAEDGPTEQLALGWTTEIPGTGQSSPIVWKETIYVTSVSGEKKEHYHVSAYRISNGKKLWQYDLENASPQENTGYVSKAAPTPAADEEGLICFFEGGNVVALTHGGEVRWKRNLVEEYGPIDARHGLGASVEQTPRAAFVWVERQTDPYLLAVDKKTGENLWKVPGLGVTSWASPRLVPVKGGVHLVLSGIGKLVGFDPENGQRLWTLSDISGNSTPTPVPLGKGRFVMGATEGRGEADSGNPAESNGVIAIKQTDEGAWSAGYLWRAKRATSSFGSPIAHSGNVYFVNRTGVLYCLDAENGKEHYAQRTANSIWATPLGEANRIWLFGKDGIVQSLQTGNSFRSLSEINVFSPTNSDTGAKGASPSADSILYAGIVVGETLLVRSTDKLYCFRR